VTDGDFIVAGENFGGGSSREHAPLSLVGAGVNGVVAQSFARIFFRNCVNLGLPILICPNADRIEDSDEISLHFEAGIVENHTHDEEYDAEPLPPFLKELAETGGLKEHTKARLEAESE
jgi:3-isopropylmalate/(R)-2-methylmalate dehydratase small subunit